MGTLSVRDVVWKVACTNCDYLKDYEWQPGNSLGDIMDSWLITMGSKCLKCQVTLRGKGN